MDLGAWGFIQFPLYVIVGEKSAEARDCKVTGFAAAAFTKLMELCFEKGIRKAGGGGRVVHFTSLCSCRINVDPPK